MQILMKESQRNVMHLGLSMEVEAMQKSQLNAVAAFVYASEKENRQQSIKRHKEC